MISDSYPSGADYIYIILINAAGQDKAISPVSVYISPDTFELSPYSMKKVPLCSWLVTEFWGLYLFLGEQTEVVQSEEGTQRSEEPVSKSMVKPCRGTPIESGPAHSEPLSSSVNGSL